jgi:hypothetical protein
VDNVDIVLKYGEQSKIMRGTNTLSDVYLNANTVFDIEEDGQCPSHLIYTDKTTGNRVLVNSENIFRWCVLIHRHTTGQHHHHHHVSQTTASSSSSSPLNSPGRSASGTKAAGKRTGGGVAGKGYMTVELICVPISPDVNDDEESGGGSVTKIVGKYVVGQLLSRPGVSNVNEVRKAVHSLSRVEVALKKYLTKDDMKREVGVIMSLQRCVLVCVCVCVCVIVTCVCALL